MPLIIVRNDITKMKTDAIVNAANTSLKMGGGVCGAIFAAAGADDMQAECDAIGGCDFGDAVITSALGLPSKHVVHTAGPIWRGGKSGEPMLLRSCYIRSLQLALEHGCESISFPLISSGVYGYPKDQALRIAVSSIGEFLLDHDMTVYLAVYDRSAYLLSEKLFSDIKGFIDDRYVEEHASCERARLFDNGGMVQNMYPRKLVSEPPVCASVAPSKRKRRLADVVGQLEEPFSKALLRLIDEKGMTDVETYKRANIDRKLFSKIRSSKNYSPSKATAIAFAIALELSLDEARDLIGKAGYTLSRSSKFDLIVEYFIEEGNYSIYEINEALFDFNQPTLGA